MASTFTYEIQYSLPLPETGDQPLRKKWLVLYKDGQRFWVSAPTLVGTPYDLVKTAIEEFKDVYPEVSNLVEKTNKKTTPVANSQITGTVLSDKGKPLQGVSISILDVNRKPLGRGTTTDSNGKDRKSTRLNSSH